MIHYDHLQIGYRVFALDIVLELLNHPLRQPEEGALSDEDEYRLTYKFLVKMVMSRCSDKAPRLVGMSHDVTWSIDQSAPCSAYQDTHTHVHTHHAVFEDVP